MKKIHIIGIVIISITIGVIISTITDSSTYSGFQVASENPDMEFQVVGVLNPDKEISYDPEVSPYFSFYLIDKDGKESKALYKGSKPQDFERSDQVVLTGMYVDGDFMASKILLKCPSKYNDGGTVEVKAGIVN